MNHWWGAGLGPQAVAEEIAAGVAHIRKFESQHRDISDKVMVYTQKQLADLYAEALIRLAKKEK